MAGLGWQELVIVLVIVLIIFGAGRLPEVAKSLGQGVKEFRREAGADDDELEGSSTASTGTATLSSSADQARVETPATGQQQMRAEEI
jgi:sec-independent protein translocase protein TatA